MASLSSVPHWDHECDLLICGYGMAGASAAIEAADRFPDAAITVLEKAPREHAGGNARVSGQSLMIPGDRGALLDYQRRMSESNPIPEDLLAFWADEMCSLEPWIRARAEEVGARFIYGTGFSDRDTVLEYPEYGASNAVAHTATILPIPSGVWLAFDANVSRRNIDLRYRHALSDLVQDPDTLEVFGAIVQHEDRRLAIRARHGVVLATGGYENNLDMQRNYFGLSEAYAMGTPYNTGDGIRILQKAGADLWHMRSKGQSGGLWPAIKTPHQDTAYLRNILMQTFSWIDLASDGRRFYSETDDLRRTHYKEKKHGHYVDVPLAQYLPVTMLFDEVTRQHNSLVFRPFTWNTVVEGYAWSEDNSAEVDAGLIVCSDTLEGLAEQLPLDTQTVLESVQAYNAGCAAGDDAFGRDPGTLQPIAQGPFYALNIVPGIVCTGGGARRNSRSQVLGHDGRSIPRLYEAGELGSMFSNLYQNGCYLTEAMITGRAAARDAMQLKPWGDH
jgi:succinate dehydrogenase/fumarate reductase flavoprotein subunit